MTSAKTGPELRGAAWATPATSKAASHGIACVRSALTASLLPREGGTLTAFAKGALLVGGQAPGGPLVSTAELVLPSEDNPDNQVLAIAGPAVIDHASIALQNGAVLLTGGRKRESATAPLLVSSAAHLFTESSSELVAQQLDPGLLQARAGHSMTRLGNEIGADVLILGGHHRFDERK